MRDLINKFDDNGSFTDFSNAARDYLRDDTVIGFVALEDRLLFGLYKPFNSVYLEFNSVADASVSLSFKYYNGTSFVDVSAIDDTLNYARSGFIKWDKPDDWASLDIDGDDVFWIEVTSDIDFNTTIRGLNSVLSDDNDLLKEQRQLMTEGLAPGDTTFIAYQVAARDEIIQSLRNGGHITRQINAREREDLQIWDLLKPDQLRVASKYLALSKIMFDISSNTDDKWYGNFRDYQGMYGGAFKLYLMAIDTDDDGKDDAFEVNQIRTSRFIKV